MKNAADCSLILFFMFDKKIVLLLETPLEIAEFVTRTILPSHWYIVLYIFSDQHDSLLLN